VSTLQTSPVIHDRKTVRTRYEALMATGGLERDAAQERVVAKLDALGGQLVERRLAHKGNALGWLFGRREKEAGAPKGLYIWGHVGRGKTMLMDLFFEVADVERKRRAHFHAFMTDVHQRIFAFRQRVKRGEEKDADPIAPVAAALAVEASLLCFDEFTVTDIADAMILGRLFTNLFAAGVTVVATSNVEPSRLYEGGLNRALFLPFIALLKTRMEIVELDARTDFRLEKLGGAPVYHAPAGAAAGRALDEAFRKLTGVEQGEAIHLTVRGHPLEVPEAAGGIARFGFADLCAKPLGAADYLTVAERFHTIILDHIPVMDHDRRNEAKRFITLIDTLYDRHVKLIASAEAEPTGLYLATEGREAFEFERTVSRLIEMRSNDYLAMPHGRAVAPAARGIIDT